MELSSVNNNTNTYKAADTAKQTQTSAKKDTTVTTATDSTKNDAAAVYEKGTAETPKKGTNQIYNKDAVVAQLKADQESRMNSMQNLVQKLLGKQGEKFDLANGKNLADTFRSILGSVDQTTIDEAKQSISEDGYWGVNQTSDRMVSMAIALSGGDTSKADEMMAAIEKGYKKATKAWGEDLPQICQDTMAATRQKMSDWKTGVTTASDYSDYLS